MTGRELLADVRWHLRDAGDDPARILTALDGCVLLTREEAALCHDQLASGIRAALVLDERDAEDVGPGERAALALLTPEEPS